MIHRIYLDNCCFNRPYDDQTQLNIYLETQAKLHVKSFDYTEWRKDNLFVGMSIDEIIDEADRYCNKY